MPTAQTEPLQSRLGKRPIDVPKGVNVTMTGERVDVQGPKGKLSYTLPALVSVVREGEQLKVSSTAPGKNAPRLQGLARALVANMVTGTAEGFVRVLELQGTGYRAELKGRVLHLSLGFAKAKLYELPPGVEAELPKDTKGTVIILTSADKAAVGQAAASIRAYRPPEPYGGKGVRYRGEQVRRKAGKAGKK